MLEKRKVWETCIRAQEEKIEVSEQSLKTTRQSATDAVPSMASWSDTTKFQQSELAIEIHGILIEAKIALNKLRTLSLATSDTISVGSLFSIKDTDDGEITNYFLIFEGGGDSFDVAGERVIVISAIAPLAKAVLSKKKYDKVTFRNRSLEIIDVR